MVLPFKSPYRPEAHLLHLAAPGTSLYSANLHILQAVLAVLPVLSFDVPAGHNSQPATVSLPTLAVNLPDPHFLQASSDVIPITLLYFPAPQNTQADVKLSAYDPLGHVVFV